MGGIAGLLVISFVVYQRDRHRWRRMAGFTGLGGLKPPGDRATHFEEAEPGDAAADPPASLAPPVSP